MDHSKEQETETTKLTPTIHISNLCIGYDTALIKEINLRVDGNKLIALIGRNGKGKSTLLKTLSGELKPIEGRASLNGNDIHQLPVKERAKCISTVATNETIVQNITAKEYISFGRYPYTNWLGIPSELDEKMVKDAIELCGCQKLIDRPFEKLSDGERQRIKIAKSIAQDTPIIILDEPTSHLDLIHRLEILKLLKKLSDDKNKIILYSTHNIEHALQLANELWLVDENVQAFTAEALIEHPNFLEKFSSDNIYFDTKLKSFQFK